MREPVIGAFRRGAEPKKGGGITNRQLFTIHH